LVQVTGPGPLFAVSRRRREPVPGGTLRQQPRPRNRLFARRYRSVVERSSRIQMDARG